MRKILKSLLTSGLFLLISQSVFGQITVPLAPEAGTGSGIRPLPGSHFLWKKEQALKEYLSQHPELRIRPLRKEAWSFNVGVTHSWYAIDFNDYSAYLVPSTCRAVGVNCYVFVEDAIWGEQVTQASVDSVQASFDLRTPANPVKGIFRMDVDAFGTPPDVDNDPRIVILILDIKDTFTGTGGYVAGYFYSGNEFNLPESNMAEIYFVDANPANLNSSEGLRRAMSTTAHEFQHMIHWNMDSGEIIFVNEGCSLVAEVYCGYPIYDQLLYINETNHYLLDWRYGTEDVLGDYSRAARFMTYIRDQVGMGVFKRVVASMETGITGIDAGLTAYGSGRRFSGIFKDWLVANILDDATVDPSYGYTYPNLPKAVPITYMFPNVSETDVIEPLAARYLCFTNCSQFKITFTAYHPLLLIKAVEIGPSSKRVVDVSPGTEFSDPALGSTYDTVYFIVINTSESEEYADYSYEASGVSRNNSVELKWDLTEPVGYLALSEGDTVCVTFDAVPGAKLDSIRVALRRAGSITGGVWRYTGDIRPTPLGSPLAAPITASLATTTPIPYPVPFQNWATVDLSSYKIDTETPFAVGFVYAGIGTTQPRVMVTKQGSGEARHSFTYLNDPGGGSAPNWYYLMSSEDTTYAYLIRAYASFKAVTGAPVLLSPPNGQNITGVSCELSWTAIPEATSYMIQVATDSTFQSGIVVDAYTTGETRYVVEGLQSLAQYFWRVRGKNNISTGPWSGTWFFSATSSVAAESSTGITKFALFQNYPNPFNPETRISFQVPRRSPISVKIYDLRGGEIAVLADKIFVPGQYDLTWTGTDNQGRSVPSGVYICRLAVGNGVFSRKMILIR
jgi:hypothetical protein